MQSVKSMTLSLLGPLLDVTEVAAYLGKSVPSIYRLIRTGKLEAIKVGGEWRISEGALRAFLEAGIQIPKPIKSGK